MIVDPIVLGIVLNCLILWVLHSPLSSQKVGEVTATTQSRISSVQHWPLRRHVQQNAGFWNDKSWLCRVTDIERGVSVNLIFSCCRLAYVWALSETLPFGKKNK